MKKEIEAFVNAANEQELEAAWNNLSAEEQRIFEQLMDCLLYTSDVGYSVLWCGQCSGSLRLFLRPIFPRFDTVILPLLFKISRPVFS